MHLLCSEFAGDPPEYITHGNRPNASVFFTKGCE